jgi:hypothetical protein
MLVSNVEEEEGRVTLEKGDKVERRIREGRRVGGCQPCFDVPGSQRFPPLRTKLSGVVTEVVLSAVSAVQTPSDCSTSWHKEGMLAVLAATLGKNHIPGGNPHIRDNRWPEPQRCVCSFGQPNLQVVT